MLIAGAVALVVALLAVGLWYAWYRSRGRTPPPETPDETRPAAGRDPTWDPRRRYD